MSRSTYHLPLYWGLLHGINDFAAGYMLAHFIRQQQGGAMWLILYAILGFGGQLPVGFALDTTRRLKPFVRASVLLLPLALLCYPLHAPTGIVLSGLAAAFVHVTGGAICLGQQTDKAGPLALFTAPGVLGLTLGGALGSMGLPVIGTALLLVALPIVCILRHPMPSYRLSIPASSQLDSHDWLMLALLLWMCFRSLVYDVVNQVAQLHAHGLLIIGISAFAGKIIGGYLADKIGWKKYVYISLPLALLLFQLGQHNMGALAFGVACLQGSVPITLLLMARSLPLNPATAAALSLGASVALAGLPLYLLSGKALLDGWGNGWLTGASYLLLLAGLLLLQRLCNNAKSG